MNKVQNAVFEAINNIDVQHKIALIPKTVILDLITYNFRNAITCCYFADRNFKVTFLNPDLCKAFNLSQEDLGLDLFALYRKIGIKDLQVAYIQRELATSHHCRVPNVQLINGCKHKNYSLYTTKTNYKNIGFLEGVQGQFVDRSDVIDYREVLDSLISCLKEHEGSNIHHLKLQLLSIIESKFKF